MTSARRPDRRAAALLPGTTTAVESLAASGKED